MGYISEKIGNLEHDQRLGKKLADAVAMLQHLEWAGCVNTESITVQACSCCYNWKPDSGDTDFWNGREARRGHKPDCKLNELLQAYNAKMSDGPPNY